jgi:hypothetical protein
MNVGSKILSSRWFFPAMFLTLSLLSLGRWNQNGDTFEFVRAVGFALLVPNLAIFPRENMAAVEATPPPRWLRALTLAAWWVGAGLVIYALAGSWL